MVNWDTALAYQTAKFVRVKDKRLGALHYFFMFMILCYAVGTILYYKRYSMFETPSGLARLNVKHPDEHLIQDVGNLSYCVGGTPTKGQISNGAMGKKSLSYPCQYRDEFFAAYPQIEHDCLLITTRYSVRTNPQLSETATAALPVESAALNFSVLRLQLLRRRSAFEMIGHRPEDSGRLHGRHARREGLHELVSAGALCCARATSRRTHGRQF